MGPELVSSGSSSGGGPRALASPVPFLSAPAADGPGLWQRPVLALLALIALSCLHALLYHLHNILVPFVLGAFIVLALQPTVEVTYRLLAGLAPPYRWCGCCCRRRRPRKDPLRDASWQSWTSDGSSLDAAWKWCAGPRGAADEERGTPTEADSLLGDGEPALWEQFADGLLRFLAVSLVLWAMLLVMLLVIFMLFHGAIHMKENWEAYRAGLQRLMDYQDNMIDAISKDLHMKNTWDSRVKEVYNSLLSKAQEGVWATVNRIVSGLSEGFSSAAIVLLYVLFWLLQPLPTGGKAGNLVRSYIYKKTLVSFLYGLCVTLLFVALSIDLAVLFGTISFFLNFVPEVGAFISMLVPVPVILLDGRLNQPFLVLGAALVGQLLLKFVFGNVLEVKLIERDREMNIHPVWVILGLSYFGYVWGPIGMLISVPILAMLKTAAMSARSWPPEGGASDEGAEVAGGWAAPEALVDYFLACFEGRKGPPQPGRGPQSLPASPLRPHPLPEAPGATPEAPAPTPEASPGGGGGGC